MDARIFYDSIRRTHFGGRISQEKVDNINGLVKHGLDRNVDLRWIAYVLGTAYHETAFTMRPIEEYGRGRGKPYGRVVPQTGKAYYGRGYVQLTWAENYHAMGQILGVDLVGQPELALDPSVATEVIWTGMVDGMFNGRRLGLGHFFNSRTSDWYQARRTVNILDKAAKIAEYSVSFYEALLRAAGQQPRGFTPMESVDIAAGIVETEPDLVALEIESLMAEGSPADFEPTFG